MPTGSTFLMQLLISIMFMVRENKICYNIELLAEKMKAEEPLTIVSPGTVKRNFTHIEDIIEGLTLVGEYGYGDGFGIGSDETFSILK